MTHPRSVSIDDHVGARRPLIVPGSYMFLIPGRVVEVSEMDSSCSNTIRDSFHNILFSQRLHELRIIGCGPMYLNIVQADDLDFFGEPSYRLPQAPVLGLCMRQDHIVEHATDR